MLLDAVVARVQSFNGLKICYKKQVEFIKCRLFSMKIGLILGRVSANRYEAKGIRFLSMNSAHLFNGMG